jgi:hypothetical protein
MRNGVPLHVVCEWIGNSMAVAQAHYLKVTDSDFNRAAGGGAVGVAHRWTTVA